MEAMVSAFSSQFLLTEEEQMEIIVDSKQILGVKIERFLLVGKLLSNKPYNKEAFRRTMYHLWRPKVQVLIVEINQDKFSFAFNTREERAMILQGGPWLFNSYLLVLAEADGVSNPVNIPLTRQEFWVQVKGLPLTFMTRTMGKLIGETLGGYVLADRSKKAECMGSYLRVRIVIDITKPLHRSIVLRLDGETIEVALKYEKIPITCYRCGVIGHRETSCTWRGNDNQDDKVKPYGKWFQQDVMGPEYRKPLGRRFGMSPPRGWSMRAPEDPDSPSSE
ncbi:unnamed protein product, partial [Prunus brigantina]